MSFCLGCTARCWFRSMQFWVCVNMHAHIHIYTYVYMHADAHVRTHECMYMRLSPLKPSLPFDSSLMLNAINLPQRPIPRVLVLAATSLASHRGCFCSLALRSLVGIPAVYRLLLTEAPGRSPCLSLKRLAQKK